MFLLSNYGLIVATLDGIFYVNQSWTYLLAFDATTAATYLNNFSNIQVKKCDLQNPNIKQELRLAKYSIRQDVLLIELSTHVLIVKFVFSEFHPHRLNTIVVSTLLKGDFHGFGLLSAKNSLGTCFSSHELCLFRHENIGYPAPDKMMTSENLELARFAELPLLDRPIIGVTRIKYNFENFTSLSTIPIKNKNWDVAVTFSGPNMDYFALVQDGVKFNTRDRFKASEKTRVFVFENFNRQSALESTTLIFVNERNEPKYYKINEEERLKEVTADEAHVSLVFSSHEHTIGIHAIHSQRIICQVFTKSLLLRSDESDQRFSFATEVMFSKLSGNILLTLDKNLHLSFLRITKNPENKIVTEKLGLTRDSSEGLQLVTAFSCDDRYLVAGFTDGYVNLYHYTIGPHSIQLVSIFRSYFLHGSAILKNLKDAPIVPDLLRRASSHQRAESMVNEIEDLGLERILSKAEMNTVSDPWRSSTDPSWDLVYPLMVHVGGIITSVEHIWCDSNLYLFIQLSSGDLFLYKTIGSGTHDWAKQRLKRLTFDSPLYNLITSDEGKHLRELTENLYKEYLRFGSALDVFALGPKKYLISGKNVNPALMIVANGEVIIHSIKSLTTERVRAVVDKLVLWLDGESKVLLARLFEPDNIRLDHTVPCLVYSLKEPILRVIALDREGSVLILLCKHTVKYRLLLFDISSGMFRDQFEFAEGDRVINVKKIQIENKAFESEDVLCVMYVSGSPSAFYSKWRLIKVVPSPTNDPTKKMPKFEPREEYTEQEVNELITTVFTLGEVLFLAVENRLIQLHPSGGYKATRTYYPNLSYIVDASVSNNSVILTNIKGTLVFCIWMKDQKKLIQKTEISLGEVFLYESKFLDLKQAKIICTDSDKCINIVKVATEGLGDGREDITLKIHKLQRIHMSSRAHSMDSLKNNNGLCLTCSNGTLDLFVSRQISNSEDLFEMHKLLANEVPHPAGVNPVNNLFFGSSKSIEKWDRKEYFIESLLSSYTYLSTPLQHKLASSINKSRTETVNMILESFASN